MKSTTAIIIFLCIAVVTCVLLCIRHKKEYWGAIISSCLILGGFLAAIINAASPVITTIYGFDKNSYSKQKYFLFYKANLTPDKSCQWNTED